MLQGMHTVSTLTHLWQQAPAQEQYTASTGSELFAISVKVVCSRPQAAAWFSVRQLINLDHLKQCVSM